eukprot:210125_1
MSVHTITLSWTPNGRALERICELWSIIAPKFIGWRLFKDYTGMFDGLYNTNDTIISAILVISATDTIYTNESTQINRDGMSARIPQYSIHSIINQDEQHYSTLYHVQSQSKLDHIATQPYMCLYVVNFASIQSDMH